MALVGYFRTMARNNAWSNHRLLAACARSTPEELDAPRTGFFPSLRLTLNHILLVDGYYLDALEGIAQLARSRRGRDAVDDVRRAA